MGTAPGPTNLSAAAGAASAFLSSIPALRTPPPMPAPRMNPRRETPRLGLPETSESFFELTGHSFHAVERDSQTVRKRIGCEVPPEYTRFFSEWRRGGKNISTHAFLNSRGRDSGRPLPPAQIRTSGFPHTAPTLDEWRQSEHSDTDARCERWESTGRTRRSMRSQSIRLRWLRRRNVCANTGYPHRGTIEAVSRCREPRDS